jgi:hypothetical protein
VPQGFNYQSIARDNKGNPITGAVMQVKIGILSDTIANTMVWEELFNPVITNAFGMFNIVVGTGVYQSGPAATFSAIDWTKSPLFLRTSIFYPDSWKIMGTTKLQSVPYSLVAGNLGGSVSQLTVSGNTTTMDSALFVVRNNTGQIVFAVYNEGVRIYVSDTLSSKGSAKGGFAIGSFDKSKGTSQPLFVVGTDSIRAYIDDNGTKAVKGGFAIGGFDKSKGSPIQYLRVTDDSTRILTADTLKGFGVGNLSSGKAEGYLKMTPSNYLIGHQAGNNLTTGLYNSLIGFQSGFSVETGYSNSFLGYKAGFSDNSGSYNVFMGNEAGFANMNGSMNTFIGYISGMKNYSGYYNSFYGDSSGYSNNSGNNNTFIGGRAGSGNTTGYYIPGFSGRI